MSEKSFAQEEQEADKIVFTPSWLKAVLVGITYGVFVFGLRRTATIIILAFAAEVYGFTSWPELLTLINTYFIVAIGIVVFMFITSFLEAALRVRRSRVTVTDESVIFPAQEATFPIIGTTFEFSKPGLVRRLIRGETAIVTVSTGDGQNRFYLELSPKDLYDLKSLVGWLSEE